MWKIFDELIEAIPPDLKIDRCLVGLHWVLVKSAGIGMAVTPHEYETRTGLAGKITGMRVRELAAYIKSWHGIEAALGLAAINSVLNKPGKVENEFGIKIAEQKNISIFNSMKEEIRGKKVAFIGHFKGLEDIEGICDLVVLERRPLLGDYPDPACEYLLSDREYVFITGTTIINKTLPRLLELCRGSKIILTGPSTPLTPLLFRHGIDVLAGTIVTDEVMFWQLIKEGGFRKLFKNSVRLINVQKS